MSNKNQLELRNEIKLKKPNFIRQDSHKIKKLEKKWRRPKGRHSKMRLKLRGYRKSPSVGYSSPKKVKGLNNKGLDEILVNNIEDLSKIKDKNKEIVLLSSKIGLKKKIEMLKKVKEMGFSVANIKDIDAFINNVDNFFKEKKKKREEKETKKQEIEKEQKEVKEETKEQKEGKEKETKRKVLESKKTKEK